MEEAINIVLARIPDLLIQGIPVPEHIEGKRPWHVSLSSRTSRLSARATPK